MKNKSFADYLAAGFDIKDHIFLSAEKDETLNPKDLKELLASNSLTDVYVSTRGANVNDDDRYEILDIIAISSSSCISEELDRIWQNYRQQPEKLATALLDLRYAVIGAYSKSNNSAQKAVEMGTLFFDEVGRCLNLLLFADKSSKENSSDKEPRSIAGQAAGALTTLAITSLLCAATGITGGMIHIKSFDKVADNLIDKFKIARLKSRGRQVEMQAQV